MAPPVRRDFAPMRYNALSIQFKPLGNCTDTRNNMLRLYCMLFTIGQIGAEQDIISTPMRHNAMNKVCKSFDGAWYSMGGMLCDSVPHPSIFYL